MNAVLVPVGLPVYLVHTSNPSVPNHPTTPTTAFAFVQFSCLLVAAGQRTLPVDAGRGMQSHKGHGTGFAQRSQARRLV
jgi:hypothetical protein